MADVSFSAGSDEECEILVGMVHEDLQALREKLQNECGVGDMAALENAIAKTEEGIQETFEWWLEARQFRTLRAARKRTKVMPTLLPCTAAVQQSRCRKYGGVDTVLQKLKRLHNCYLL
ncbi:hypothetical protein CAPTEDRAFT_206720 [Capitella teleta]|uniref:Uncharacterized protein n=1 Tax=Capitella teleta TaxID=283909 RepID=R7U3D1_CAPTE|nr:hypothetical protein CAPTEDRAFT_206720 [Capitella teleta]|eukprot:ELT97685.1 hypothetical protein CAPTEDRAFT_206720 [Capitella teleta]